MSKVETGHIKIEHSLPAVFKDQGLRTLAHGSLEDFRNRHNDYLPLKFRIEDFCFQRQEQICTVDSARKYIAWDGSNRDLTAEIFSGLTSQDNSLVLRSHPMQFGMQSPTLHTGYDEIQNYLNQSKSPRNHSDIEEKFFSKLDLDETIIQLLKNPYAQSGLYLCRPTFIYDEEFRHELSEYKANSPQYLRGKYFGMPDVPDSFVGFRIIPIMKEAREKKNRDGGIVLLNRESGNFEFRDGFPYEAKLQIEDEFSSKGSRSAIGRTIDYANNNETVLHYDNDTHRTNSAMSIFLTDAEMSAIQPVLEWQLPRIFSFEDEIRRQKWIPQGLSNTHQFVIFPPDVLKNKEINTQYYDFRPHQSLDEMVNFAAEKGEDFKTMQTIDKIKMFY